MLALGDGFCPVRPSSFENRCTLDAAHPASFRLFLGSDSPAFVAVVALPHARLTFSSALPSPRRNGAILREVSHLTPSGFRPRMTFSTRRNPTQRPKRWLVKHAESKAFLIGSEVEATGSSIRTHPPWEAPRFASVSLHQYSGGKSSPPRARMRTCRSEEFRRHTEGTSVTGLMSLQHT
jgi:hypothetical protein